MQPWGSLYFVTVRTAFTRNPKELVANINARREGTWTPDQEADTESSQSKLDSGQFCVLMVFVGVAYGLL
jgi:hypothetical protein